MLKIADETIILTSKPRVLVGEGDNKTNPATLLYRLFIFSPIFRDYSKPDQEDPESCKVCLRDLRNKKKQLKISRCKICDASIHATCLLSSGICKICVVVL